MPDISLVRPTHGHTQRLVSGLQPRFDEYSFKKITQKAPSPHEYQVKTITDIDQQYKLKSNNETFGNGERFYEGYQYSMRIPLKFDENPSPNAYSHKSTFEINKDRAFFMGVPPYIKVDGGHTVRYKDVLAESMWKRKAEESLTRDKPNGPGTYQASEQGTLSASPNPPAIKFGSAIQRDDSFLQVGDPNIDVSPDRYNQHKFLNPVSNHVNLEKSLRMFKAERQVDFRRLG